jgi:hypothetical protein
MMPGFLAVETAPTRPVFDRTQSRPSTTRSQLAKAGFALSLQRFQSPSTSSRLHLFQSSSTPPSAQDSSIPSHRFKLRYLILCGCSASIPSRFFLSAS